ncbi:MAG: UDP-N-acetylmuramoyl-L-alanine--D-glutamate ligase [Nitrospinae bacterium]|nr:UDP-N-acetylmuramoyl-L-alanine--D-glutamate ligase [Nitrospinota bacterium]
MDYKNKKALIIGLAKSGAAAALLIDSMGGQTMVTDVKPEKDLAEFAAMLPGRTTRVLGSHDGINPAEYDLAVISPGVPWEAPLPAAVRNAGVELISEVELAFRHLNAPVMAVTGANGKTTTTTLTGRMMSRRHKTFVGGNIGDPLCWAVGGGHQWAVVEMSSFQLEGIKTFRPKVSAVLNVTPDHMDRHKTMEIYAGLKARLFENQREGDTVILNAEDPIGSRLTPPPGVRKLYFGINPHGKPGAWVEGSKAVADIGGGKVELFTLTDLKVPGTHNVENALAASLLSLAGGASVEDVREVIVDFEGLPHRMERVGLINGVAFINDSKGTNTDASIKSLSGYKGNVVIIAGGSSKGADFTSFAEAARLHAKGAVLIGKTAGQIKTALGDFNPVEMAASLEEAVRLAAGMAASGDTVLLSPACASFDMFRNYEHRGEEFRKAVAAFGKERA